MLDAVVIIVIVMYYLLSPRQSKTHVAMNPVDSRHLVLEHTLQRLSYPMSYPHSLS